MTEPQDTFEFIFQLYNFLSAAKADNDGFYEPQERLLEAKDSVARKEYPTVHTSKRKREESRGDSNRPRDPPAPGGTRDSLGDALVLKELGRAGYTLTELPDELRPLTPVSHNSSRCAR